MAYSGTFQSNCKPCINLCFGIPSAEAHLPLHREWTDLQIKASETCNVAVMYASAYGNTASLAQAISRGVTKAGDDCAFAN